MVVTIRVEELRAHGWMKRQCKTEQDAESYDGRSFTKVVSRCFFGKGFKVLWIRSINI